jgi:hypothetical protein
VTRGTVEDVNEEIASLVPKKLKGKGKAAARYESETSDADYECNTRAKARRVQSTLLKSENCKYSLSFWCVANGHIAGDSSVVDTATAGLSSKPNADNEEYIPPVALESQVGSAQSQHNGCFPDVPRTTTSPWTYDA